MARKPSKKALDKELTALCWWLIERKVAYYAPEEVHSSWGNTFVVDDGIYDQAEIRYLELIRQLRALNGEDYPINTIVHKGHPGFEDVPGPGMMEIDRDRPSVQLVLKKLGRPKTPR
ncbi:hypothetical protein [Bradyrhizobium lupini]|uniref:hypothetical protein n=1 Tax=Rhizobium lupini TaxID=136996 RepID=UPI0034C5D7EE